MCRYSCLAFVATLRRTAIIVIENCKSRTLRKERQHTTRRLLSLLQRPMNKDLFTSPVRTNKATVVGHHGEVLYRLEDKAAFARLISNATFQDGFYVSAREVLTQLVSLANKVDDLFLAKAILYSSEVARMKEVPAVLTVLLNLRNKDLTRHVFRRLSAKNSHYVFSIVHVVRSGVGGSTSLGGTLRKLINEWLNELTPLSFLQASVSRSGLKLQDIIRLSHPRSKSLERQTMFAWALGKVPEAEYKYLPAELKAIDQWQKGEMTEDTQKLRGLMELLSGAAKTTEQWKFLVTQATWIQTVKSLNMFARHGVFNDAALVNLVAEKLENAELMARREVSPIQLLSAYMATKEWDSNVPARIGQALQVAMEQSIAKVEVFQGKTKVALDVSASMTTQSATGQSAKGPSSKVNCMQAASLFAMATLRCNKKASLTLFDEVIRNPESYSVSSADTVLNNASKLSKIKGRATHCHLVLEQLLSTGEQVDLLLLLSDNESWRASNGQRGTTLQLWERYLQRYPNAKMVCWDISPNTSSLMKNMPSVLQVSGFTFEGLAQINRFMTGTTTDTATGTRGANVVQDIEGYIL